ncbi:hypothetical protein P3W55_04165, partial [Pseudomonas citronellolis]
MGVSKSTHEDGTVHTTRMLLPCFLAVFSGTLSAQTITWTGGANDGGNWNTPGNWDLGVVPGAADDAHIFG